MNRGASKPQGSPEMVALARQVLDTTYKLADGTVLSAGTTAMRTDLSTLAWGVIRLQEQLEAAHDVLRRLRQWDVLNVPAGSGDDGPYWRGEIDRALSYPAKDRDA